MLASIVRTAVPILVGYLTALGVPVVAADQLAVSLVSILYYVVVRWLEAFVAPKFGWLLGYAVEPSYSQQDPDW